MRSAEAKKFINQGDCVCVHVCLLMYAFYVVCGFLLYILRQYSMRCRTFELDRDENKCFSVVSLCMIGWL